MCVFVLLVCVCFAYVCVCVCVCACFWQDFLPVVLYQNAHKFGSGDRASLFHSLQEKHTQKCCTETLPVWLKKEWKLPQGLSLPLSDPKYVREELGFFPYKGKD